MANKYLSASGGTRVWTDSTGTWVTTSGGSTAAAAPTTSDVAILEAGSGAVTVSSNGVAGSISGSAYANTLTIDADITLTINGAINIGSGATITGAGTLVAGSGTTTGTWTISPTVGCNFRHAGTGAKTLAANLTVAGLTTWSTTANLNGSSYNVYAQNGYTGTGYWSNTSNSPALYLQGGTITGTVGGASSNIYLNGNITFATGTTYQTDIRTTGTVQWISGTTTHTNAVTRFVSATPTIDTGTHVAWNTLQFTSGTYTLASDLYVSNFLTISGSPTINGAGYKVYVANDVICYGVGTYAGTFDGIVMAGTGTFGSNTSPAGASLDGAFTFNANLIINSSGTVTFKNKEIFYGGSKTLTYTAGTVVATGSTFTTSGYTFDIDDNFTIPTLNATSGTTIFTTPAPVTTMNIATGATVTGVNGIVIGTLRQDGTGIYQTVNGATTTVSTAIYHNGTDSAQPQLYANPISLPEFVASRSAQMNNTGTAGSSYRRVSITSFNDVTDFTFAFDYTHTGYLGWQIISGSDGYLWTPSSAPGSLYFFMTPGDAYYSYIGISPSQRRIVITKASGSAMKFYVNGELKSTSVSGTSANLINADINFGGFASQLKGDVLFFSGIAKDATWVESDYAAFQANGNSSAGLYDDTEADLTAGWHVDSWTNAVTNMILTYNGTTANQKMFRGDFRYVDASLSANRLKTYFGSVVACDNVIAITGDNFKTLAYASA